MKKHSLIKDITKEFPIEYKNCNHCLLLIIKKNHAI